MCDFSLWFSCLTDVFTLGTLKGDGTNSGGVGVDVRAGELKLDPQLKNVTSHINQSNCNSTVRDNIQNIQSTRTELVANYSGGQ